MSLDISFPAFHYGKAYLGTLVISREANNVKLSVKSSEVATFKGVISSDDTEKDLEVPISSLGTYAVRIRYDALRDALAKWSRNNSSESSEGENRSGVDIYPILFTFNKNYGTVGMRDVNVAVLSGVATCVKDDCLKERSEAENTYLLIIRSPSRLKTEAGWQVRTACSDKRKHYNEEKGDPCWLFSFIIIDKYIKDRLTDIVEDQKDQERISYEVDIETHRDSVHSASAELYISSLKYVKVFLRSFPLIRLEGLECPSDSSSMLELCRGDLEYIHVGSQITVRCEKYTHECLVWQNGWWPYRINFISPVIISYPMDMPKNPLLESADRWEKKSFRLNQEAIPLPQDKVLNTSVVKFSIKDFTWDKAVKLIDWLWAERPDALFKLLLNEEVISAIEQFIKEELRKGNYRNCDYSYKPKGLFTKTTLYGKEIIIYSPSVKRITELYNSIKVNKVSGDNHGSVSDYKISDVVAQVTDNFPSSGSGSEGGCVKKLLQDHEDKVEKILSIFALAYGLHGVSHLLMKALTALTGITDYTEFIRIEVDKHWGQDIEQDIILEKVLKNSGFRKNVYHENVFEIIPGDKFDLNVYVISREPYSYAIYYDRLVDRSSGQLKLDDVKTGLKKLISYEVSHESKDACEVRWQLERNLLSPYRSILLNPNNPINQNVLSQVDNLVKDYLDKHFKPPRSLFRYLYAAHIRKCIRDKILKGFQQGNNASDVKEIINTNIQYIWPYHLPQCIDGCYGCVLMERSISSRTCDLSPLVQELKVSKWSALCLLKYAGLIDESWVNCKLT